MRWTSMAARLVLAAVVATGVALAAPGMSRAQPPSPFDKSSGGQGFPVKPVRLVIATGPGSQPDGLARMLGQKLSERWGWGVVIDNRPGAGGVLAASLVAKAAPDGHTLLYALPNFAIATALQPKVPYDPFKDFAAISHIGTGTNVLVASPALGAKSVSEFIAAARAQPGKLILAAGGTGSAGHLTGVRFNLIAGIKDVHETIKGGPEAAIEVLAGRSHYTVGTMGVALPFVKEGKLVALAVATPQRSPILPDVPALGETMPEFRRPDTSHGLLAPAGTPRPILERIGTDLARTFELPDVKERLQAISYVPSPSTPEEYSRLLRAQIEALNRLVSDAGLRPR